MSRTNKTKNKSICLWGANDENNYETGCGNMFCITESNKPQTGCLWLNPSTGRVKWLSLCVENPIITSILKENKMKYCCYCGRRIRQYKIYDRLLD